MKNLPSGPRGEYISRGRLFEMRLFGRYAEFDVLHPPAKSKYCDALVEAFYTQPSDWNPMDPSVPWANFLLKNVREHLAADKKAENLGLYLGLGTALDWHYGVDAFFALDMGVATLDVTTAKLGTKRKRESVHFVIYEETMYLNTEGLHRKIANKVCTGHRGLLKALDKYTAKQLPEE